MDRLMASRLDAWITREPPGWDDDIPLPPKCSHCGRFMKDEPIAVIGGEDWEPCNGIADPDYGPSCDYYYLNGTTCPGEPHWYVVNTYSVIYRRCSCGEIAKEFVI